MSPHKFIVVEGPIGVGKTSLAKRLANSFGSELVLEQADENPFIERFYKNPRAAALPTQLFFLMQRARQLEEIRQHDLFETVRVGDYLIDKDRLFARLTLDDEEYALYEQVFCSSVSRVAVFATSNRSSGGISSGLPRRTQNSSMITLPHHCSSSTRPPWTSWPMSKTTSNSSTRWSGSAVAVITSIHSSTRCDHENRRKNA
jgi:hypothetical protein